MATHDERGREILDQTPLSLPIKFSRPEPIHQRIRRMILHEIYGPKDDGIETFEEANDFLISDDPSSFEDNLTPYEDHFDHIPPDELAKAQALASTQGGKIDSPDADPAPAPATSPQAPTSEPEKTE